MTKVSNEEQSNNANLLLGKVLTFLESNKKQHHLSDDCWYTCPKHPEGCCNSEEPDRCNCGADEYNRQVDELLEKLKKHYC